MKSDYKMTIGLEIHAELKTETKMFCDSKNDSDEKRPNVNVCPICMGHPGTLPVVNKEAVKSVLRVGLAVNGNLAKETIFDRKNYFYPDIPKGYQISQYKFPLVSGGSIKGVSLTRIHLEEDTAKSLHEAGSAEGFSLIDFNRAGVPLMELVTEPLIHSPKQASDFAKELQLILRYLGVADADMEKGGMRVEANISVSKDDNFGTKVEVKNLNSFRSVEQAILFEYDRQISILEKGGKVEQETRGWDENKGKTFSQRKKEDSHDYRYFPDPDIPPFDLSMIPEFSTAKLLSSLPELPNQKRERYSAIGLKESEVENFVSDMLLSEFFDKVCAFLSLEQKKISANYILSDLLGMLNTREEGRNNFLISPKDFADLIRLVFSNKISSRGAKDILKEMYEHGGKPEEIAREKNLFQTSDEWALAPIAQKVLANNPKVVAEYKSGKTMVIQFLVGQCMKESRGAGNPQILKKILEEILKL